LARRLGNSAGHASHDTAWYDVGQRTEAWQAKAEAVATGFVARALR
jgi:hypothetical protein